MADEKLPTQKENFSEWYNQLVLKAELADYAPVRGCMVVRPYGWTLWENMQAGLDRRFKETGHVNAAFPMLIPMSFFEKEKDHVEGFRPNWPWSHMAADKNWKKQLAVRPTSETIIGYMYSQMDQILARPARARSTNGVRVLRWELRTKLFLRTAEFYWQEGHTAHATDEEAMEETYRMLDVYADFAIADCAIPVIKGVKSDTEKFAGAQMSTSIEAMMADTKALQSRHIPFLRAELCQGLRYPVLDKNNHPAILPHYFVGPLHAHDRRAHHGTRRRPGSETAPQDRAHPGCARAHL